MAGSRIAPAYFEGLSYFEVEVEFFFIFVTHVSYHFGVFPVYWFRAVLLMCRNTRVLPIAGLRGFFVLFSSCSNGASGLANIFSLIGAWALELVDARL